MTSIYDIPYENIKKFLLVNNKTYNNEDEAYNIALILLKDKKATGHTISIIEWMMAHNLLIRNINIHNYTMYEIDNMSQAELEQLAKLLTMRSNNIKNIKNILRYLHKLDDIELLPEINDIILRNLNELEINDVNVEILNYNEVLDLLETYYNKSLIRKLFYQNMEKIIFYNFLDINVDGLNDLEYIEDLSYQLPKSIILELIKYNEKELLKNHTIEEINNLIDYLNEKKRDVIEIDLYGSIEILTDFLIDLIKIKEIALAKKVFDIANKYNFKATITHNHYSFNQYLVHLLVYQKDDIFNKLLEFIGEDNFILDFDIIIVNRTNTFYIKQLLHKLIKLEKYDLLIKILNLLNLKNYKFTREVINIILPRIKKAIESKNNNLIMKYIDILNLELDGKLQLARNHLRNIDNLGEDKY